MSAGCESSHSGFPDCCSSGGLRISGWIGQLSCLTVFSTSLSACPLAWVIRMCWIRCIECTESKWMGRIVGSIVRYLLTLCSCTMIQRPSVFYLLSSRPLPANGHSQLPAPTYGRTFRSTSHLHSHSWSSDSVSWLSSFLVPTRTSWYDLLIIVCYYHCFSIFGHFLCTL